MSPRSAWRVILLGWVMFSVSAICFSIVAVRDGGVIELVASLTFLLACIVFMIPAILNRPDRD